MTFNKSINLKKWIEENRALLKPPVGNKLIWEDADTIVMVVGGPNARKDYHVNQGEEFFYQVEGSIILKIIQNGKPEEITLNEGDIYLLRSNVPHSPQRPVNSVGIVIEQKRARNDLDRFQWYCEKCANKLHEESIELTDIVKQLPPLFKRYYEDAGKCTCKLCGHIMQPPQKAL